jgi:NAD(P)-dependent dehydrogenase (short-subunit alcohol dehydrogenase family)
MSTTFTPAGRFAGKNVLITGGSGGIGKATAERIAAEGGRVLITGTNRDKLDGVKAKIPVAGIKLNINGGRIGI